MNAETPSVSYRLLGPVQVLAGERPVDAGPLRQRSVLAALLVDAGRVVEWTALVDRVWGRAVPVGARGSMRVHVTRIRQVLRRAAGDAAAPQLVHRSGGYALEVDEERVDLHRFRRLVLRAGEIRDDRERLAVLREAVALWRGTPLAGIGGDWAARMRDSWSREHLDATVAWADAELDARNAAVTIGPLAELTAEHPLVESLTATLMRAQHALGRTADAVQEYTGLRTRLADALGVDPEPELQALYQALLRGEPIGPRATSSAPTAVSALVPAQLPAEVHGFVGRVDALADLDALLDESTQPVGTGAITAVSGTAGVGKTTLAVHWAYRVADRFPDGQLYADLRGYDPGGSPVRPTDALRGFLEALGVPRERIPAETDVQAAHYRSLLAGRRVLILLDNARDAEQVRPLLPGTPTALTVVTSRDRLLPLLTVHGAHPLPVDVLSPTEARQLLTRRLGVDRVTAEPAAVEDLVSACGRLPLALAIVCARARQTAFPLTAIAAELDDVHDRLDALDAGDPTTRVRAVFSWSLAALIPDAARLFRLLGLHPGPHLSTAAAASLAGRLPRHTRPLLAELVRANLLTEPAPGRFAQHDLLRAYAADLAHLQESGPDCLAAMIRLLDHYLHTAHGADRLLHPIRDSMPVPLTRVCPATVVETHRDRAQALAWFTVEHTVLQSAMAPATDAALHKRTWQFAWILNTFLTRTGRWQQREEVWQAALRAAELLGESAMEAHAHRSIAAARGMLGDYDGARSHCQQAMMRYAQSADLVGQAQTHHNFGYVWERLGRLKFALDAFRQSYQLSLSAGHRWGEAEALNAIGWCYVRLGRYEAAIDVSRKARLLACAMRNPEGEAFTSETVGLAHHNLGQHAEAVTCYRRAINLFRELNDRYHEARALTALADTHEAAGAATAADAARRDALDILNDLRHPQAKVVSAKLDLVTDIPTEESSGPQ